MSRANISSLSSERAERRISGVTLSAANGVTKEGAMTTRMTKSCSKKRNK